MTSSLSSLPLELQEDIFSRTPIVSLLRFKTTSKNWYAFFNDKKFIYKHLDLSKERFIRVNVGHQYIQIFDPETSAESWRLPTPDELHNYTFRKAIHCHGLLLSNCIIERGKSRRKPRGSIKRLAVWNPFTSRVTWIEPSSSYKRSDIYGFGYDRVSRDNYKILRIGVTKYVKFSEIEIYEFKSKLWRSVDATPECNALWDSVSMDGNMYWFAQKMALNPQSKIFIQSFDFSTETFKPICCLPMETDGSLDRYDRRLFLSGSGGDRLSLLHHHTNVRRIVVWVTSKLTDGVVSWSKCFNVTPDPSYHHHYNFPTYFIHKTNKTMFLSEELVPREKDRYIHVYEMCEDGIKKLVEIRAGGDRLYDNPCNVYVPSLVPVPYLGEHVSGEQVIGSKQKGMFRYWCQVCSFGALCRRVMRCHESGQKHMAAIERRGTDAPSSIIIGPQSQGEKRRNMILRCEICNTSTCSEEVMKTHELGKKHKARLEKQFSQHKK